MSWLQTNEKAASRTDQFTSRRLWIIANRLSAERNRNEENEKRGKNQKALSKKRCLPLGKQHKNPTSWRNATSTHFAVRPTAAGARVLIPARSLWPARSSATPHPPAPSNMTCHLHYTLWNPRPRGSSLHQGFHVGYPDPDMEQLRRELNGIYEELCFISTAGICNMSNTIKYCKHTIKRHTENVDRTQTVTESYERNCK
jgi:hypothetical protein